MILEMLHATIPEEQQEEEQQQQQQYTWLVASDKIIIYLLTKFKTV